MVWTRLLLSCAAFLSAAGGISYGLAKLSEKIWKPQNPALMLALYKLALVLYWVPVSFVWICAKRISYENKVIAYKGEFVCSTVPPMTAAFRLLGYLWLAGFVIAIVRFARKQHRLFMLMRGNVPVAQLRYLAVFEECRRQFGLDTVMLCQNDLLPSPITAGLFRQQVILPFAAYTDAELRMIYEHELTHIQHRDLFWRMLALVTSWVHWFNPLIYLHQGELDCLQEMVCDLSIAVQNEQYTKKEYAAFLLKLTEPETVNACTTALIQNKSQTLRRIQQMAKTKEVRKPKKFVVGLSCAGLAVFTLIPATAVSAKAAKLQEDWIRAEEVDTIAEPQDFSVEAKMKYFNSLPMKGGLYALKEDREYALQERITARDLRIAHLGDNHFSMAERQKSELQSVYEESILRSLGQNSVLNRMEDISERLQEKLDERDQIDKDTETDEEIRDNGEKDEVLNQEENDEKDEVLNQKEKEELFEKKNDLA